MRLLFDTNVVLDVLMSRAPHVVPAARLFVHAEQRTALTGLLGATSVTTIHYLLRKSLGAVSTRKHMWTLLRLFEVAPVTRDTLSDALNLSFSDFEDAVLHEAARLAGATGIVTRDAGGFRKATLRVYTPAEALQALEGASERS